MAKTNSAELKENPDSQAEIERLKKEVAELRSQSKIATLETEKEDLQKQKVNAQISQEQSLTNVPGYDEEFTRLKEDAVKQARKMKKNKIISNLASMVVLPIAGYAVYKIAQAISLETFFELDPSGTQTFYTVITVVFIFLEIMTLLDLIKTIFFNPEVIEDQTLSYLSLTAKEHILDPKGSIIREKYGVEKWSAVTKT